MAKRKRRPIESHKTAALAGMGKIKPASKVTIPSKSQINSAKQHVDSNEK